MLNFFKTRPDLPLLSSSKAEMLKRYKSYQWQVFIGLIFGYAMFYVVRMALGVGRHRHPRRTRHHGFGLLLYLCLW